jgi:hypothetical protein
VLVVTAAFLYGTRRKEVEEKHVEKVCCQPSLKSPYEELVHSLPQLEDIFTE